MTTIEEINVILRQLSLESRRQILERVKILQVGEQNREAELLSAYTLSPKEARP